MIPTTLTSWAVLIWKGLESEGLDPRPLFVQAGLNPEQLHDPNARYPVGGMTRLWNLAVQATGDECFGLLAAGFWHPTTFHALGYAWLASDTLKHAFERMVRYVHLVSNAGNVSMQADAQGYWVTLAARVPDIRPAPAALDATFAAVVRMCRTSYGEDFAPRRVQLAHGRPACAEQFESYFRCAVEFDASPSALLLDARQLDAELPTANAELAHASDKIISQYLAHLDRTHIAPQVKAKLLDLLSSGKLNEAQMAVALNQSERSLQRKLRAEGTSFSQLLEETRRELAQRYIENSRLSITETAYLLGFAEPANFTRAFRRWTGQTPSDYRQQHVSASA
jgi:AraC-like DNA-binding protein